LSAIFNRLRRLENAGSKHTAGLGRPVRRRPIPGAAINWPKRESTEDWPPIPFESTLYFLRHGAVWIDAAGEFTKWRTALHPGRTNLVWLPESDITRNRNWPDRPETL
jgi:hypothetical protein